MMYVKFDDKDTRSIELAWGIKPTPQLIKAFMMKLNKFVKLNVRGKKIVFSIDLPSRSRHTRY